MTMPSTITPTSTTPAASATPPAAGYSAPNNPAGSAEAKAPVVRMLLLSELLPSILNPRKHFDADALTDLANDIAMNGVHQPLTVRPDGDDPYGGWQIVMGERRFRAAKQAGLESVPCIIRDDLDDAAHLRLAYSENAKRSDLTPIENAEALSKMLDMEPGLTQSGLGQRLGISQSKVANGLRLLKLPFRIKRNLESGRLSESVGIVLCGLLDYPDTLETLAERAATEQWTQTLAEAKVKETKAWCEQQAKEREGQTALPLEGAPAPVAAPVAAPAAAPVAAPVATPTPAAPMESTTTTPAPSAATETQETQETIDERSEASTSSATPAPAAEANASDAKAVASAASQAIDAVTAPQVTVPPATQSVAPQTTTVAPTPPPTVTTPATPATSVAAPTAPALPIPTTRKPVTGLLWEDQQEWLAGQGLTVMTGLDRLRQINPSPEAMEALVLLQGWFSERTPGEVPLTLAETLDMVAIVYAQNKGLLPTHRTDPAYITTTTDTTDAVDTATPDSAVSADSTDSDSDDVTFRDQFIATADSTTPSDTDSDEETFDD